MSERAKELWSDFLRYLREAWIEWRNSVTASWEAHVYTALIAVALFKVFGWIL